MTDRKDDKKDNRPAGGTPAADNAGGKRPHAVIDLEATEVLISKNAADAVTGKGDASKPDAATRAAGAGTKPGDSSANSPGAAQAVAAAAAAVGTGNSSSVPGVGKGGDGARPADTANSARATADAPTQQQARAKALSPEPARARGSMGSHLFAGIVGGALSLMGAQALGPMLGLVGGDAAQPDLARRLAAIEQTQGARSATMPADLAQSLAAANARLARLEDTTRTIGETQVQLAGEAKTLDDKIAKQGGGDLVARFARLEEQMAALTAAAAADPRNPGRIPQLAQITGKLGELEAALASRSVAVKKEMSQELDQRVAGVSDQAEQARARLAQRAQSLEQSVKSISDETGALRTAVDGLKGDLDNRFKATARPQDVQTAIAPLSARIAGLETSLQGVVKSETDRNATAGNILLSLELGNLKRALERGGKYASELAAVKKLAGDKLNLSVLEAQQNTGVPSQAQLLAELRGLAHAMLDAESDQADATLTDRMLSGVKSIVRVRKTKHAPGDTSTEAQIARMEAALTEGRVADAVEEAKKLSPKTATPAAAFLLRLEGRSGVEKALSELEASLKTSLAGGAEPKKGTN